MAQSDGEDRARPILTSMRVGQAARLVGRRMAWRATRSLAVGRPLVEALGSSDEDVRVFAGVLLTRSGRSVEPLLVDALHRRENIPAVLEVLAGIADDTAEREIGRHLDDPDPAVVEAAESAQEIVTMRRRLQGKSSLPASSSRIHRTDRR
jgi:hypothetical protein